MINLQDKIKKYFSVESMIENENKIIKQYRSNVLRNIIDLNVINTSFVLSEDDLYIGDDLKVDELFFTAFRKIEYNDIVVTDIYVNEKIFDRIFLNLRNFSKSSDYYDSATSYDYVFNVRGYYFTANITVDDNIKEDVIYLVGNNLLRENFCFIDNNVRGYGFSYLVPNEHGYKQIAKEFKNSGLIDSCMTKIDVKLSEEVVKNNKMVSDKKKILDVITGPEGYEVQVFGKIDVVRDKRNIYHVYEMDEGMCKSTIFNDPDKAVDYFLELREKLKVGYDFEQEINGKN